MVILAPMPQGPYQHISLDHVFAKTSGAKVIDPLTSCSVKSATIRLTRSYVSSPSDAGLLWGNFPVLRVNLDHNL